MSDSQDFLGSIGSDSQDVNSIAAQLDAIAGGRTAGPASSAGSLGRTGLAVPVSAPGSAQRPSGAPSMAQPLPSSQMGVSVSAQRASMLAAMQGISGPARTGTMQLSVAQQQASAVARQQATATASGKALTLVKVVDAMKLRLGLDAKQISLVVSLQRQFMSREIDFQMYIARLQQIVGRDTFGQIVKTYEGVREKMAAQDLHRTTPVVQAPQRAAVLPVAPRGATVVTGSTPVYSSSLSQGMLGKRAAPTAPLVAQPQPGPRFGALPTQPQVPRTPMQIDPSARLPVSLQQQLVVNVGVMQKRIQEAAARQGLRVSENVYLFLALAIQSRMKSTMEMLITYSKTRSDECKVTLPFEVTFEPKALLRKIGEKDEQDQKRRDEEERLRLLSEAAAGDEGAKKEKLQKFLDAEDNKRTNNAALQAAMITSKFKSKINRSHVHSSAASVLPPSTLKLGSSSGADLLGGRLRRITTRDMHAFLEHDICLRTGNSSLPYVAFSGKGMSRKVRMRAR